MSGPRTSRHCSSPEDGPVRRRSRIPTWIGIQFRLRRWAFWLASLSVCLSSLEGAEIDYTSAYKDRKITAVRIHGKIILDGKLDEPEWQLAEPAANFIQKLPATGEPATEPTEVRLLYDDHHLYVGAICLDSAGPSGIVVTDITKDFYPLDSDNFQILIDTYDDNRNAFIFGANASAGRFDMQVGADGNRGNISWDGVWFVETEITESGYQVEMAIPFKTLRFKNLEEQVWGVNFQRRVRRKFEDSHWAPLPPQFRLNRVSLAGTLNGIHGVEHGFNAYFKPYLSTPVVRREGDDVDFEPTVGLEVFKWSLTSQLTLDGTINTDFSQVEADDVQINLTRFSLFFPEKRDFFLENASIFDWGRQERGPRGRPDLLPFFSRRIGLTEGGKVVPILGGARLTGRAGAYTLGMLTMQTGEYDEETPSTNFTVTRVSRDILRQSDIGGIFVNRQGVDGSYNRTYGFDSNLNFFRYLDISTYALKTDSPELEGDDYAGNVGASWSDGFFEVEGGHLRIGENFNPEVGFAPRTGIHKTSGEFGITPRPRETIPWIRELNPQIEVEHITNTQGELETRRVEGRFTIEFSESSLLSMARESNFERLFEEFEIRDGIIIAPGDYNFEEWSAFFRSNRSRMVSLTARAGTGAFWDGSRDSYRLGVLLQPNYKLSAELEWSHNNVELSRQAFQTDLIASRFVYSFTNNMWLNALIQYNGEDREVSSNIRFNWMFKPLSDFFLVYNERRTSEGVLDRALIAKITYVLTL